MEVYNTLGMKVATLVDDYKQIGSYTAKFNSSSIPGGMYIYRLRTNGIVREEKMLVMK